MTMPDDSFPDGADNLGDLFDPDELDALLADVAPNLAAAQPEAPAAGPVGVGWGAPATMAVVPQSQVATPSLHVWLDGEDDEEDTYTPAQRPGRKIGVSFLTLIIILTAVLGVAALVGPGLQERYLHRDSLLFKDAILSAQPIQLSPLRPARVEELYFDYLSLPDEVLPAGTPVARLSQRSADGLTIDEIELSIPVDARFAAIDSQIGSVVYPGSPIATVYDPSLAVVLMTVEPSALENLRRGMRARIENSTLNIAFDGTIDSAVPLLGSDFEPSEAKFIHVRVRPDEGTVTNLVPGVRLNVRVDTNSVDGDAPRLLFNDSGGAAAGGSSADPRGGGTLSGTENPVATTQPVQSTEIFGEPADDFANDPADPVAPSGG